MTSNYLTNLNKKPQTRKRENITKIQDNNLQKVVEGRGEYKITQYSIGKPLNTSLGDKIRVHLTPKPNLHNYNLHKTNPT